ncbi:hypothetical protein ROT00_07235 [Agromyces mediolanus]|uniref:hypothetical protein n=1 Tax=Agromyces mediolanus TaxID=41986 RepID=UPI003834F84D
METHGEDQNAHGGTGAGASAAHAPNGVSIDAGGFLLAQLSAPRAVGEPGELSFQVLDASGDPVTDYTTSHERELHTIVVRSDGAGFRHVHPTLDEASGTWSLPWEWDAAGSYRLYADFTPAGDGAEGVTLSRSINVAGELSPVDPEPSRSSEVDGFVVTLDGELVAGAASELTLTVERDGRPVTALEPYLGAFGHLVALRQGDLAFLHVHPEGEEPEAGSTGGPEIAFAATAPTPGRYLLYLDFQVDGEVRTAEFVLDAASAAAGEDH